MLYNLDKWRPLIANYIRASLSGQAGKSILDIGLGESTNIATEAGFDVHAMDRNTFNVKKLDPRVKYVANIMVDESIANIPQYDIVMACELLEHCEQPEIAAINIMKLVKSGGYAIITMPCFLPWHPGADYYGDYFRVMPTGLTQLFRGYKVAETRFDSPIQDMPYGIGAIVYKK